MSSQFSNGFIVKIWYDSFSPKSAARFRYLVTTCNRPSLFAHTTTIAVEKKRYCPVSHKENSPIWLGISKEKVCVCVCDWTGVWYVIPNDQKS